MNSARVLAFAFISVAASACGNSDDGGSDETETGGHVGSAGANTQAGGMASSLGGNFAAGGTNAAGATLGGASSSAGGVAGALTGAGGVLTNAGGSASTGGSSSGGASAVGGKAAGGSGSNMAGSSNGGASNSGGSTAKGGNTATGGSASGGTSSGGTSASGGAGSCTPTWNPPATANGNTNVPAGLEQVWAHSGATIVAAPNLKIHQIMANKGTLSYCVRWDSTKTIGAAERDQIETLINKCDQQWFGYLKGWGCWPYDDVKVKVTLWAVKNRALLNWDDSSTSAKVVVNSDASCPSDCGPWDPKKSFASCSSARFDEFFWLDGSVTTFTGWGSATGFMMGADYFLNAAKTNPDTYVILAHEMGHSHGLDDFYDWKPDGWKSWIMNSGSSQYVTDTDGWMLRDVWRHIRSKYGYPGP